MKKINIKNKLFVALGLWSIVYGLWSGGAFTQEFSQQNIVQDQVAGNRISLDIKGMEITDVLKMLSLRSGKNIVAGKNVRGKVTVFLKDVDVMDALEIILISNELAYDMKGNIINVMTDREYEAIYGERFQDTKKLKVIKLKYAKAADVSKALNQIKSRVGKTVVDEISNALVVIDSPQIVAQMEELAKAIDVPVKTRIFPLNYSKAETMKAKLEPLLTRSIGTIQIDERTNKIIITDLENNMKVIESAVAEFDEKTKEVLIDAKILQITLTSEYQAGINWDAVFAGLKAQMGMNFNVITESLIPSTSSASGGAVHIGGLDTKYNVEAMIKFLQKYGKTNLLASPRIVAINNEEAKILVGKNQPYATSQTTTPATGASTTSFQVTFLDLGTKLYVTPTINRDGFITMKVKPEVSSTTSNYSYGSSGSETTVPIVNTSQAETTVMVKDGNTIVIAGLIESRDQEEVKKVPGLGDLPLIGGIFRSRTKGSVGTSNEPEKNELVIFLTPHIISGEVPSAEVSKYSDITEQLETQLSQEEMRKGLVERAKRQEALEAATQPPAPEVTASEPEAVNVPQKELTIDEYYSIVRKLIFEKVKENYPAQSAMGEANLSFRIGQDGRLIGVPLLLKPADKVLKDAAIKSVQDASPFPAFPANFKKKEATFKIVIIYE
ncbi:MAG: secretin N-terminal domain-containing protein [Candidatus Omnitrophica bacterium]|nr:secretin N-terminal domain-containing protein [Candidatus Omnitrophota bacterium]